MKKRLLFGAFSIFLLITFVVKPSALLGGAARGMLICSEVIIPSLFPFTVLALMIFNCDILGFAKNAASKISYFLFGLPVDAFFAFIMSFIGGFPVGARLISALYENNCINKNTAERMLYYSVNPGPAFVIVAVGTVILNSKEIGLIIYLSNIIASLILCFFFSFSERKEFRMLKSRSKSRTPLSDVFVNSVTDSAISIISVCGFVILFSSISEVLKEILKFEYSEYLLALTEVSQGVNLVSENIFYLSFLTAFSGFCVHFQVLSAAKNIKISYIKFLFARLVSGILSMGVTVLLVKIFKISIPTSTNNDFMLRASTKSIPLSAMLIFMCITLIITVKQKFVEKSAVM